jgi:hypothetical protein
MLRQESFNNFWDIATGRTNWYLPGTKSHTDAKLKEAATSLSQGPPLQGPVLPTDAVDEQDGGDIGPVGGEI